MNSTPSPPSKLPTLADTLVGAVVLVVLSALLFGLVQLSYVLFPHPLYPDHTVLSTPVVPGPAVTPAPVVPAAPDSSYSSFLKSLLALVLPILLPLGLLGAELIGVLRRGSLKQTALRAFTTYFRSGWLPYLLSLLVLALVGTCFWLFDQYAPAFMQYGWTWLLDHEVKARNVMMPSLNSLEASPPLRLPVAGLLVVLLLLIPDFASLEEKIFRRHVTRLRSVLLHSLAFGLAHMAAGISLAAALSLSVGGLCFAGYYLLLRRLKNEEEAFKAVSALHAIYNGIIVSLGLVAALFFM